MISLVIWVIGLALLALLLFRGAIGSLVTKYRWFYLYLAFVFLKSSSLLLIYLAKPNYYRPLFWYTEMLSAGLGCGVVWQIYRTAFRRFPGAARMARNVLTLLLVIALSKVLLDTWNGVVWWPVGTLIELEWHLRVVQAAVLLGLLLVFTVYRIALGRNLWGMMLGYGLFIGANLITLALRVLFGDAFQTPWQYLQPLSYLGVLSVWCATLWSYTPTPSIATEPKIENDYLAVAAATRNRLLQVRTTLGRALRP